MKSSEPSEHMDTSITIKPLRPLYPSAPQLQAEGATAAEDNGRRKPADAIRELTSAEARVVEQLKRREREVRTHELAHKAIAGRYARGAPSFDYQVGPDGRRYVVEGEVNIDLSKENDPREALRKAEVIRAAAMAPANPSMQDRQIAMQASAMAAEARQEIMRQKQQAETRERHPIEVEPIAGHAAVNASQPTNTGSRRALASISSVLDNSREHPLHPPFDQYI